MEIKWLALGAGGFTSSSSWLIYFTVRPLAIYVSDSVYIFPFKQTTYTQVRICSLWILLNLVQHFTDKDTINTSIS